MPKMKTRKSVVKRFRVTKTGKVMRRQSFRRHLNAKKTAKRKRALSKVVQVKKSFANRIKKALGK
jgi:ribosomal protein L35